MMKLEEIQNKKNVLFWVGVNSPHEYHQEKHGGFKYFEFSRNTWEWWCKKHDVLFFPYTYDMVSLKDTRKYAATWQRWFDVFPLMEKYNIPYNKIAVIDASTMVRWDCPNFFNEVSDDGLTVFRSLENLRWVSEGVKGYNDLFNNFSFDLKKYFSCGFQIFNGDHKEFLFKLKEFFFKNELDILELQNKYVKRGTDQPVYNYLTQVENVKINLDSISQKYFLNHLYRFDWAGHNWQLNSNTPHFLNHGWIYFFSGFPNRGDRENMMKQLWEATKLKYV